MHTNRRLDWSYLLLYPYMAVTFIPWVKYRVQFRLVLPLLVVWVFVAFYSRRQLPFPWEGTKYLIATLFFLIMSHTLSLLYFPFGYSNGMDYASFVDLVMSVFPLSVLHFSICNGRWRELRALVIFCFICCTIGLGINLLGESIIEGGSRALTGSSSEFADLMEVSSALEAGIGGYGFIYGLALLIFPILFFVNFMNRAMKFFLIAFSLLILGTTYKMGYSICMTGVAFAGFIYLITRLRVSLSVIKLIGVIVVSALVTVVANPRIISFMLAPLQELSGRIDQKEYQMRLESIADAVAGTDNTYAVSRSELYWTSWKTFLRHPFFGIGHYDYKSDAREIDNIGGHSLLFDMMGHYGLFGLSIFLLFFFFYRRYLRVMSFAILGFQWWSAYYIFLFPAAAIAFINPLGGYVVYSAFLFVIPSLALFSSKRIVSSPSCEFVARPPSNGRIISDKVRI